MRDELLGYLLGALDEEEHQRVEEYVRQQEDGRRHLELLRNGLAPLATDDGHVSPPTGLAGRTCRVIAARRGMSEAAETGPSFGGGLLFRDYLIAASIVLLASTILLPAIARSRWQAQVIGCQHQLQALGTAVSSYSDRYDGMLPYVPDEGPIAVAGIYAPLLSDFGYVQDPSMFYCPGAEHTGPLQVPRMEDLQRSAQDPRGLARWLASLGNYAYVFGYVDELGRYRGPRNQHRSTFPVLADCPPSDVASASDLSSPNHGGGGFNMLFEDGHARWYTGSVGYSFADDHPFLNRYQRVGPGIGPNDAVLAPSDKALQF